MQTNSPVEPHVTSAWAADRSSTGRRISQMPNERAPGTPGFADIMVLHMRAKQEPD